MVGAGVQRLARAEAHEMECGCQPAKPPTLVCVCVCPADCAPSTVVSAACEGYVQHSGARLYGTGIEAGTAHRAYLKMKAMRSITGSNQGSQIT